MSRHADHALAAANRRSVIAMSCAMASFVTNDALVKYVSQTLPSAQLIFIRGLFATLLLVSIACLTGALRETRGLMHRTVVLRSVFDALATMTYLTSLFHLPIANATAINMATPLFITLFAVIALHERVGGARWLAILTGFAGVLMVVQPTGAGFNAYALLCLAGTLLHAGRDLTTRFIDRSLPSILVTVSTAVAVTLLSGVLSVFQGWSPVSARQLGLLAAASVFLSGGYYLITNAMREGEMSLVAPFRYAGLLFAIAIGWLVWGDVPNLLAAAGIALLVGAGLYVLRAPSVPPSR